MQPIKTALQGFGFSAQTFHLPFLQALPQFELVAVNSSRPAQVTAQLGSGLPCYPAYDELLAQSDIELVIITGPNSCHFDYARQALAAGKHLLLEKPAVTSVAEALELERLAAEQQRVLCVFQNRRYDGDFLTVKALLDEGVLGSVRVFESHFDRFRPQPRDRWREQTGVGSGIFWDLGPHLLDQALLLFGQPEHYSAQVKVLRDGGETVDYVHLVLEYPQLQVILHSSPYCAGPNLRFKLEGDQGSYWQYGLDPQESRLLAGLRPTEVGFGDYPSSQFGQLYLPEQAPRTLPTHAGTYVQLFTQLAAAIRTGADNPVPMAQVMPAIEIIAALNELSSDQTLVE